MTKDEFEKGYAKRSNVTVDWLHEQGQGAVPCNCGEKGCLGWQMVNLIRDQTTRDKDRARRIENLY